MSELKPDEKLCPFCAETIKKAAIKCRWCGSELPADAPDRADPPADAPDRADPLVEVRAQRASRPAEESDEAAPVTHAEPVEAPRERRTAPSRGTLVTGCLIVLLVAAIAGLALAVRHANADPVAPDGELSSAAVRAGIMTQGGRLAETAMSYRAAQADQDIAAAEKLMTPAMRKEYEKSLPAASTRADQAKEKVTVTAALASLSGKQKCQSDDCAVSIVSAGEDRARVLVFVDQSATAASSKKSVASPTWELLTLVKKDGTWLIDDMASS